MFSNNETNEISSNSDDFILQYIIIQNKSINNCGKYRLRYLKEHRKVLYYNLLISGNLEKHIVSIEEQAQSLFLQMIREYIEAEDITNIIMQKNPINITKCLNSIYSDITEKIFKELIYK